MHGFKYFYATRFMDIFLRKYFLRAWNTMTNVRVRKKATNWLPFYVEQKLS